MEGRGEIAVGSDLCEVLVPGLARIGAQLLLRSAEQQVPGAFDVIGGEGMPVVPFDALAQAERQFGAVLVPRPIGSQIRDDRLQAVLRHVLLVQDKVVENSHHWDLGRVGRFLEDRHAGRTVPVVDFQNATRLLGRGHLGARNRNEQHARRHKRAKIWFHFVLLPLLVTRVPDLLG